MKEQPKQEAMVVEYDSAYRTHPSFDKLNALLKQGCRVVAMAPFPIAGQKYDRVVTHGSILVVFEHPAPEGEPYR